jgi:hypothetical protein
VGTGLAAYEEQCRFVDVEGGEGLRDSAGAEDSEFYASSSFALRRILSSAYRLT